MEYLDTRFVAPHQQQASGYERLFALAAFLETLPPNIVTFGCWYRNGRGCAIGLAAASNAWFRGQGLRLSDMERPERCHPVYGEHADWNAVAAFFELDLALCRELFTSAGYKADMCPEPQRVAARIWSYLDGEEGAGTGLDRPGQQGAVGDNFVLIHA